MRFAFLSFLIVAYSSIMYSQIPDPYGIVNNGSSYSLATIDLSTGTASNIAVVPNVTSYVLGNKHCISAHDSVYSFVGFDGSDARLYSLSLQTGSLLSNPAFNGVVVGLRYNCNDSSIYALQDTGGRLDFVTVDRLSGITTTISLVGNAIAYVGESFTIDAKRNLYHFIGYDGPDPRLYSIDISSGNVVGNPLFGDNVTALAFNCSDSLIYGLWESTNQYQVEIVDPVSGTHATVGVLANVTPGIIIETATITESDDFTFAGFDGMNNPSLISFDAPSAGILHSTSATINYSGLDQLVCCLGSASTSTDVAQLTIDLGKVYPNPNSGKFVVTGLTTIGRYSYNLFNMLGEIVHGSINTQGMEIRVPIDLRTGLYFLVIYSSSGKIGRELVIIE